MDKISILGGKTLEGIIPISGSKNASLPILASSLLTNEASSLSNVPNLLDVITMKDLLTSLGINITSNKKMLQLEPSNIISTHADYELVRKMRASVLVLGPLLTRYGEAEVSLPGGCAIGSRPVDIHINALKKMGTNIEIKDGYIKAKVINKKLVGADITFPIASVGATENIIMAASLAKGKTLLRNVALEPEVDDLIKVLNKMGAYIKRRNDNIIEINGVNNLKGFSHAVMPDRIEAGTYAMAAVITAGNIKLLNADKKYLKSVLLYLNKVGAKFEYDQDGIIVQGPKIINNVNIKTEVYPGFPTDLQAQAMALMVVAEGSSVIEESIFENRFMHIAELVRFGAIIKNIGFKAHIEGCNKLNAAQVMATDLRASSSLILAGLKAEGKTIINRVYHLDRGYEDLEKKLSNCGANIRRI
ncbi:MAG: UDP-N-acetylglucosamine 1-carboxyvinyltransferase [Alphaproteobacteria bacterium MarineAlpha9_Bin3]|nr:MAG: UDP-N-acetylglucosamine 1-carboxyvinyltransferase [Alphaproteobacteria bacterium MarineAlpha9_Bin3]|tara:strand:+ start:5026 stop:6279 length:1254 start_codon:yes stop_codon:yes gene_type:complete